jgi:hypothetical protein
MKQFISTSLIALTLSFASPKEVALVQEFHNIKTKKEEQAFLKKYDKSSDVDVLAYVIALEMKKAEYKFFPVDKIAIFLKQKKRLQNYIDQYPENIHLRYVRLILQEKTPAILGYKTNIEEDLSFLKDKLNIESSDQFLKAMHSNKLSS